MKQVRSPEPSGRSASPAPHARARGGTLRPPLVVGAVVVLAGIAFLPEAGSGSQERPGAHERSLGDYGEAARGAPIRAGLPEVPGGFTFCRLWFRNARSLPSGVGWSTDYPRGDFNLTLRLEELTTTWISRWANEDPGMAVVQATDPDLFRCPFLFASDPGAAAFDEAEVEALRNYLHKGGLIWVDDFWGNAAWGFWTEEIGRVLPGSEIVDVPPDHPLFSIVYRVDEVPQIPNIQSWRRTGGETSEFGAETAQPHFRAIFGGDGRILVLMTHNTDIADGWEREMDDDEYFLLFSPAAYALGVNILIWMLTH